jgi:hypothetical protein
VRFYGGLVRQIEPKASTVIRATQSRQSSLPRSGEPSSVSCLGHHGRIELLDRAGLTRSDDGRTLKQVLQIVITVSVESTNRDVLLGFLQLSFHRTVSGTAMRFDGKATVFQRGPLVRKRCGVWISAINRAARIGLTEQFRGLVLLTLG